MAHLETVEEWDIKDNGPGLYATDPRDRVSVWLEGSALHYETAYGDGECDIPLAVIDKLRELAKGENDDGPKTTGLR